MKRSEQRIITTHAGSLPRPEDLVEMYRRRATGGAWDEAAFEARTRSAVAEVVRRQVELGVDVLNDGEYGKVTWNAYINERLSGFEPRELAPGERPPQGRTRDRRDFPGFYEQYDRLFSFSINDTWGRPAQPAGAPLVCTGPITYTGQAAVRRDIDNLKAATAGLAVEEVYLPAISAIRQGRNEYYSSEEAYLYAMADAMHEEYRAITDAGFVLQIDDPGLPTQWDSQNLSLEDYRKRAAQRVELINHSLRGLPEEQLRYHICWGSWHGPHAHDLPLKDIVDLMLQVRAQAYSIEAANVRHEHEWKVWQDVKLPDGKILIPGVVSHATNVIEHPEVVADRIIRYANLVGRENVIAGTDCGLGGRLHPELVWAKLKALSGGAALATQQHWR
jgi:5-methyltetrahydropteroyltriglutamate--homocysteine methyltransferase